jgi:hypothetical protein
MQLLVFSTLPHYIAAIMVGSEWALYKYIIIASTTLSVAWHATGSCATSWLGILDHVAAAAWFAADCYYLYNHLALVLVLNILSAALNAVASRSNISYEYIHSIWHLVNAAKSIYLARILINTSHSWRI